MNSSKFTKAARRVRSDAQYPANTRRSASASLPRINNTHNQNFSDPEIFDTLGSSAPVSGTPESLRIAGFMSETPLKTVFFRGKKAGFRFFVAESPIFTKFTPLSEGSSHFTEVRPSGSSSTASGARKRNFNTFNQKSVNPVIFDTFGIFEVCIFYKSSPSFSAVFTQNPKNPSQNTVFCL
jgi:hypothetical protein